MKKKIIITDEEPDKKEKQKYIPYFETIKVKKEERTFKSIQDIVTYKDEKTTPLYKIVQHSFYFYRVHEKYIFEELKITYKNLNKYITKNTDKIIELNFKKGLVLTVDNKYMVIPTYRKTKLLANSSKIYLLLYNLNFK